MPEEEKILTDCRQYITELSLQYQDVRRVLYDDQLSLFLEARVDEFALSEQVTQEDHLIARLSALFYPIGFRVNVRTPQQAIWELASNFLIKQAASNEIMTGVELTLGQAYGQRPETVAAQLLCDALIALHFDTETHQWASLRYLEYEFLNGQSDRLAQAQLRLQELLAIRFSTNAGRRYWQNSLGHQLLLQKKKLEKLLRDDKQKGLILNTDNTGHFTQLEDGMPIRAGQTFFRTVYRNHINLSAIADNKANIMISVNSILISVLITLISYRNIAETQPMILLPVIVFLVVGLSSLVFAVLSARPKVTSPKDGTAISQNTNIAFFGSFIHISIDDYEEALDEALKDSSLLYGSMARDLYQLGKVLDKKYRYLSISYNIFMMGLIITVGLFLFTLFL